MTYKRAEELISNLCESKDKRKRTKVNKVYQWFTCMLMFKRLFSKRKPALIDLVNECTKVIEAI